MLTVFNGNGRKIKCLETQRYGGDFQLPFYGASRTVKPKKSIVVTWAKRAMRGLRFLDFCDIILNYIQIPITLGCVRLKTPPHICISAESMLVIY
jgi:hypothetical protein